MTLSYLYEDADILILHKPVGLVVHPGVKTTAPTLAEIVGQYTTLRDGEDPERPGIVHRLDKDTFGLMVVTKSLSAYTSLTAQFKNKMVEKRYYAYVRGDVLDDEFLLDFPIGRDLSQRIKQRVYPKGGLHTKDAQTHVKVLKRFRTKTLVELKPLTGRMHQLRVHMAHIGFPVIGDPLYGPRLKSATGQQLEAYFLAFDHPSKGIRLSFELPNLLS